MASMIYTVHIQVFVGLSGKHRVVFVSLWLEFTKLSLLELGKIQRDQ